MYTNTYMIDMVATIVQLNFRNNCHLLFFFFFYFIIRTTCHFHLFIRCSVQDATRCFTMMTMCRAFKLIMHLQRIYYVFIKDRRFDKQIKCERNRKKNTIVLIMMALRDTCRTTSYHDTHTHKIKINKNHIECMRSERE